MYKTCKFKKINKEEWVYILDGSSYPLDEKIIIDYEILGRKSKGRANSNILEILQSNNIEVVNVYTPGISILNNLVTSYGLECKDYYIVSIGDISFFLTGINKCLGINDFKFIEFKSSYVIFDKYQLNKIVMDK